MLFSSSIKAKHRELIQKKLKESHESIVGILRHSYEVYKNDGAEVQQHWHRYTEKVNIFVFFA